MRKGVVFKLFDVIEFITNLPVKECPDYQLRKPGKLVANMHSRSQARSV